MNQKVTSRLVMCLIAGTLCVTSGVLAESFKSMTFESIGYDTFTYIQNENVTMSFSSPYVGSGGQLNLHFIVIEDGIIEPKINNATIFSKHFSEGEHWNETLIPTGLIDKGYNTISVYFIGDHDGYEYPGAKLMPYPRKCKITLLKDSTINIESVAGTTFSSVSSQADDSVDVEGSDIKSGITSDHIKIMKGIHSENYLNNTINYITNNKLQFGINLALFSIGVTLLSQVFKFYRSKKSK